MKKANYVVSGIFALFGAALIAIALGFPPSSHGVPGPGVFPIIVGALTLICSATLALVTTFRMREEDVPLKLLTRDALNVYITMGGLIVYLVLMPMLGFVVTTSVMLTLFIKWFSKKAWWVCALIGVLFSAGVFALFGFVLHVPMRFGLLI